MRKVWFLPIVSGLLLAFAYPPFGLEFLIWFGFLPFFLFLKNSSRKSRAFWAGLLAGTIYFLIVIRWFWSVYPLDWTGVENNLIGFLLVGLLWLVSSLGMGLWLGIAGVIISRYYILNRSYQLIFIPSLFVLTEYLRSIFFGLLWAGPGTLWGPNWTIGNLAYALSNNPLILKLSPFVGIYGITFLVLFFNVLLFIIFSSKQNGFRKTGFIVLIVLLLSFAPSFIDTNSASQNDKQIPIAIVQTKIPTQIDYPPESRLEDFKNQLALLKEAARQDPRPRVIVFPEGADFSRNLSLFLDIEGVKEFFGSNFPESTLIIDNSRLADESGKTKSRVIYLDSKEGIVGIYDKQFLTPGGEFLPYHLNFFVNLLSKKTSATFSQFREFSKGTTPPGAIGFNGDFKTGALVCSGIFSSGLFRQLSRQNPDFLIAQASTSVFRGAEDLLKQNLAAVKFRAAENNKFVVLAANYGFSYIVSNTGKLEKITPDKEFRLFTGGVEPQRNRTWYNKLGDIPTLTLSLVIFLGSILTPRSRRF